jgi:hypothetical protein
MYNFYLLSFITIIALKTNTKTLMNSLSWSPQYPVNAKSNNTIIVCCYKSFGILWVIHDNLVYG